MNNKLPKTIRDLGGWKVAEREMACCISMKTRAQMPRTHVNSWIGVAACVSSLYHRCVCVGGESQSQLN